MTAAIHHVWNAPLDPYPSLSDSVNSDGLNLSTRAITRFTDLLPFVAISVMFVVGNCQSKLSLDVCPESWRWSLIEGRNWNNRCAALDTAPDAIYEYIWYDPLECPWMPISNLISLDTVWSNAEMEAAPGAWCTCQCWPDELTTGALNMALWAHEPPAVMSGRLPASGSFPQSLTNWETWEWPKTYNALFSGPSKKKKSEIEMLSHHVVGYHDIVMQNIDDKWTIHQGKHTHAVHWRQTSRCSCEYPKVALATSRNQWQNLHEIKASQKQSCKTKMEAPAGRSLEWHTASMPRQKIT